MKKYALLLLIMFMGYHMSSFAQAVDDQAVVPVSVTLNSILRLNVESGGNIEFNFNTLEKYRNGISGLGSDDQYSTKITVASSVNWNLEMGAEDPHLLTTDVADTAGVSNTRMPLGYIAYETHITGGLGSGLVTIDSDVDNGGDPQALAQIGGTNDDLITNNGGNAGGINQNAFRIDWGCGLPNSGAGGVSNSAGTLMGSNLTGGRYSTNVFFKLSPAN